MFTVKIDDIYAPPGSTICFGDERVEVQGDGFVQHEDEATINMLVNSLAIDQNQISSDGSLSGGGADAPPAPEEPVEDLTFTQLPEVDEIGA